MILEKIDNQRLLVSLFLEDLENAEINLQSIIYKIKNELNFNSKESDLFIEAIWQKNIGFFLISVLKKTKRKIFKIKKIVRPFIFVFRNLEEALEAIKKMYPFKIDFKNSLIRYKEIYFLVIESKNAVSCEMESLICEYGLFIGSKKIFASKLYENGTVFSENAINDIGCYI